MLSVQSVLCSYIYVYIYITYSHPVCNTVVGFIVCVSVCMLVFLTGACTPFVYQGSRFITVAWLGDES